MSYCLSRFRTLRRPSLEVKVGSVGVGGSNPIRLQSMTTSDTQDVAATVKQSIALAEVGCEIVRVTAPNIDAARCLKEIRAQFTAAGFGHVPLVADIHFLPSAAMEAVEHVEKIRVNPGNYADKKRFNVREYSDAEYDAELQRLHDAFSPLVKRCRELGRAMRVGTNHGSLSDRIMNRYGDSPLGMVESALEFLRIAEAHSYRQIVLSMKASNPKVMIQAYRLLVQRMAAENMHYPLHLGVTEAGDGEDGRIKSAIGIGSLLLDGLGDTIRVSLTEDSVYEIPVARAIARKAMSRWTEVPAASTPETDSIDPYRFTRRETTSFSLGNAISVGPEQPPRVIVRTTPVQLGDALRLAQAPAKAGVKATPAAAGSAPSVAPAGTSPAAPAPLKDTPAEGLLVRVETTADLAAMCDALTQAPLAGFLVIEAAPTLPPTLLEPVLALSPGRIVIVRAFAAEEAATLEAWCETTRRHRQLLACDIAASTVTALADTLRRCGDEGLLFTLSSVPSNAAPATHALGAYRQLVEALRAVGSRAPLWIRNTGMTAIQGDPSFLSKLLEASFLTGALLCDGLGDLVSIETETDFVRATKLTYNVLQGAGARISKTEFVACPSCGRTLFDLQSTTQRIREKTGHLKGVKLAIMGCIVNGPGEMADADFGYVGGAPGKINLYVGKNCVQYNIPQEEADGRLIALIKEHGKWTEPEA